MDLKLAAMAQANPGRFGMYLKVLETGEEAGYHQDQPFYAASCYKLSSGPTAFKLSGITPLHWGAR